MGKYFKRPELFSVIAANTAQLCDNTLREILITDGKLSSG